MSTVSKKTISTNSKGTKEVQGTSKSSLANEQLETQVASQEQIEFLKSLDVATLSTLDTLEDVETLRASTQPKNRSKRHTPTQVESLETQYRDSILKLKKYTKTQREDRALFSGFENGFQDKMKIIDADALSISSSVDTIEEYSYKGYPYKRAIKLSVENENVYVVSSNDEDMYGICIDVDESTGVASVIPITNNFEGYLSASDSSIKIADKLDFDSNGMLIKAGSGGKKMINAVALSEAFTIDLALEDATRKGQYQLHFVKASVYGNRF
ncbi:MULTISPECIES: DUF228 domain-containing protein [Borrelia]|uniref:Uncharacterized protein n=3 Tax=Borrelia TaxID=138 RepID=A0AAN1CFQ0_BORHE|nr:MULTISPECIES: DUF228 domain-containing protein [Borrelia]AHH04250.1 Hypothetical protein BHY_1299 [Borrelia nietonii YOR]AMR76213.1 hypothetical protein A0V01_06405 [Borrelia hermsii]ANA44044.1 hypothetical protein AXX13_R04 [Borrelia hermsii HS1]UPA08273.1 DUF228 domain-containing protein [Borrelia hermsii DAH]UPA09579.1 DUF228 domain-containing protein [Borrelia nietonii YOR]